MENTFELNGYLFKTQADYKEAKDELQGIEYINKQIQNADSIQKYHIYCNIIEKELFHTAIGINYLINLKEHLNMLPELKFKMVPAVPVPTADTVPKSKNTKSLYIRIAITAMVLIVLILSNICTICILGNSKNLNVVNYQKRLNKMYSQKLEQLNDQTEKENIN